MSENTDFLWDSLSKSDKVSPNSRRSPLQRLVSGRNYSVRRLLQLQNLLSGYSTSWNFIKTEQDELKKAFDIIHNILEKHGENYEKWKKEAALPLLSN